VLVKVVSVYAIFSGLSLWDVFSNKQRVKVRISRKKAFKVQESVLFQHQDL
jgi:hypothetical protein